MKRIFSILLTILMLITIVACDNNEPEADTVVTFTDQSESVETTETMSGPVETILPSEAVTEPATEPNEKTDKSKSDEDKTHNEKTPTEPNVVETEPTEPAETDVDIEIIAFESVNETVWATSEVNVRTGPGIDYEIMAQLMRGESVTRIGIGDNNWDKVIYNGIEAYVSHNYLSTKEVKTVSDTSDYPKTYSDETCTITVYKEWYENAWCYAAHLEFTDYTRFGVACANGKYNSGGETTSNAGNRLDAILCVNGDYATPGNGAGSYAIARGGVVCNDGANYCEAMYNSNDGMLTYRTYNECSGKLLSTLVAEGKLTDTFQFGPAFLLDGSITCSTGGGRAQRTFIGTNGNAGDIWIVVSDGRNNDGESSGLTGYQCAAYLLSKGCVFGVPLDGGGSSTIWFDGEVLNAAKYGQRAVADFVYFE